MVKLAFDHKPEQTCPFLWLNVVISREVKPNSTSDKRRLPVSTNARVNEQLSGEFLRPLTNNNTNWTTLTGFVNQS